MSTRRRRYSDNEHPPNRIYIEESETRSRRSSSPSRGRVVNFGLKVLDFFSPQRRRVKRVVYERREDRPSPRRVHFRDSPVSPPSPPPRRTRSMSAGSPEERWVPLPPRIQIPPERPRQERRELSDDEDDGYYILEERRPGDSPWDSPRQELRSPGPRSPRRRPEIRQRRPREEVEIIEVAPSPVRVSEEQRRRAEIELRNDRRERIEVDKPYNSVVTAHERYQHAISDLTNHAQRVEWENRRLQEERDAATRRAQMAEREANLAWAESHLHQREKELAAEERHQQRVHVLQEAVPPRREPMDALHRAQEDFRRDAERRRQNEELHRRNRERDRTHGIRRGSPIRFDDWEARRDRTR